MEKLEKDKVYKIKHTHSYDYERNYIICAPSEDVDIIHLNGVGNLSDGLHKLRIFPCHFIICFDGNIEIEGTSGFFDDCEIMPLEGKDYDDIKRGVGGMVGTKYNRKLNKLIYDTRKGQDI